jgi:hypothetical protein
LRHAEQAKRWAKFLAFFAKPDHAFHKWARSPEKASRKMQRQLGRWDGRELFFASQNGIHTPLRMDSVRHVFFGHTHVKFDNLEGENGVLFHNTGAIVKETSRHPGDLGLLEAEIGPEGAVRNVSPVRVERDASARGRPKELTA